MSFRSWLKGVLGEQVVRLHNWYHLGGGWGYHFINNVTLELDDGSTTQIDHVVVSRFGIFVIETKNMAGSIYGQENEGQWTQAFGSAKFRFQNPLRQNHRHTKALGEVLGLPDHVFHSVVCFVNPECSFRTAMPPNVLPHGPSSFIEKKKEPLLSGRQVKAALATIRQRALSKNALGFSTAATERHHLRSLKLRHNGCPQCGSKLKLRSTTEGLLAGERYYACVGSPGCGYRTFHREL